MLVKASTSLVVMAAPRLMAAAKSHQARALPDPRVARGSAGSCLHEPMVVSPIMNHQLGIMQHARSECSYFCCFCPSPMQEQVEKGYPAKLRGSAFL